MKFNKKWGYGELFGFSAIDGPSRYYEDMILMTMKERFTFRFEFPKHWVKLSFPHKSPLKISCLMSDFAFASNKEGEFILTFLDNDTLIGVSPSLPVLKGEIKLNETINRGIPIYSIDNHYFAIKHKEENGMNKFIIHHSFSESEARAGVLYYLDNTDVYSIIEEKKQYYRDMPKCLDKKYESLYYKSLSVNKVNVRSPEGKIDSYWTTPDRVPHRHMWMWDSAFHSMAMVTYNPSLAKVILLAMLKQMREDGFMPHMANPTDSSDITQPCVMSFAANFIYKRTGDKEFLKKCVTYLDKYLTYDMLNRDKNHNGLLEWKTEPDYEGCKCGESGLDNSPRFDFDEEMDCIDFSSFFALDTENLSLIYKELGDEANSKKWEEISYNTKKQIQKMMWDEEDGVYYDCLFSSKLTKVLTPSSFLPLLAKIPSEEQAKRMVDILTDKSLLWSEAPLASISQKDPRFSNDMWRGGMWININYLTILGLLNYGYIDTAEELRTKTLDVLDKWYKKTGCIFEFFDPRNEISPFFCYRKGKPLKRPDYRKHVHSISDYNWSACFAILLIQREF
ncbi:MAG: hypothetical protein IJ247_06130 [Bacilli bacterium]|nr:hypothetical protein [Bacilli bacterium]